MHKGSKNAKVVLGCINRKRTFIDYENSEPPETCLFVSPNFLVRADR